MDTFEINPYALIGFGFVLLIMWVFSEFSTNRGARIALGFSCIIICAMALTKVLLVGPQQKYARTNSVNRMAFDELAHSLKNRKYDQAIASINTYLDSYDGKINGGPEAAAFELIKDLRKD